MRKRIVPLVLSFIYCGLGQLYNRQIVKGLDFIIVYTVLIASYFCPAPSLRLIGLSLLPMMWFIGMVDAYLGDESGLHKGRLLLGILPGILISLLIFYILYTRLPVTPDAPVPDNEHIQNNSGNP
ncbi:hypothetical protein ACFL6S_19780 [Candidatus Poribacteria bacterium]